MPDNDMISKITSYSENDLENTNKWAVQWVVSHCVLFMQSLNVHLLALKRIVYGRFSNV